MDQRGGRREQSRRQRKWRAEPLHLSGNRSSDRIPGDEASPEPALDTPGVEEVRTASEKSHSWLSTLLTALALVITALVVSGSAQF